MSMSIVLLDVCYNAYDECVNREFQKVFFLSKAMNPLFFSIIDRAPSSVCLQKFKN